MHIKLIGVKYKPLSTTGNDDHDYDSNDDHNDDRDHEIMGHGIYIYSNRYNSNRFRVIPNRKWQDYVYIQCEYKSTKQKIKHLLREENKVKENKIS